MSRYIKPAIENYSADELSKVITHKEACEMFLEIMSHVKDMDTHIEKLYSHSKSLELELNMVKTAVTN